MTSGLYFAIETVIIKRNKRIKSLYVLLKTYYCFIKASCIAYLQFCVDTGGKCFVFPQYSCLNITLN